MKCIFSSLTQYFSGALGCVAVWKWNIPHRLLCLNTWAPPGGAPLEGCGTFRWWGLAEGSGSLWRVLWGLTVQLHCLSTACFLTVDKMCPDVSLCWCRTSLPWWTVSFLKLQAQINPSCFQLPFVRYFKKSNFDTVIKHNLFAMPWHQITGWL